MSSPTPPSPTPSPATPTRATPTRANRAVLSLLLVLALLGSGLASPATAEPDRVRAHSGLDALARQAERLLPAIRREVHGAWGFPDDGRPVEVVLVPGLAAMRAEARAHVPHWAVGLAQVLRSRILVRADRLGEGAAGDLLSVLRHEWVHLAWGRWAGPRHREIPLWLEEGLAEEIGGGPFGDRRRALDLAATTEQLIDFDRLATAFPGEGSEATLAYQQSRSWVQHFVRENGWDLLLEVLADVANGPARPGEGGETAFAAAVRARTGRGLGEWHAAWKENVVEDARTWFHLLFADVGWSLLMLLATVSVGFFFVQTRRRRRQIAALGEEDAAALRARG